MQTLQVKRCKMNYIIDGHNLISKMPGFSLSMPDDEQRLVELLIRYWQERRQSRWRCTLMARQSGRQECGIGRVRAHFVPR